MNIETWYVMEDGSVADPRDIAPGDDGLLKHKDGRAVAYAPHGPRSRSVDLDAHERRSQKSSKDQRPEEKKTYKTRESKAD